VLEHERLRAVFTVPLAVGLRPGEALGLYWQDVDLEAGTLSLCRALQRIEGKLQLVELKTRRSRRTIALPGVALAALKRHRVQQREERVLAGGRWQETALIFTTKHGTPLEPRNVVRTFKRILWKAGLPNQRFYDLRHTCASLLLAQGVHPRVVMEILWHSQISLTMNTYSHVIPQLQRDAAERMDELFRDLP
jgi:integrase